MAQPPAYNREKNFADDFGNETDHSALNAELDRAANSINDIRSNLSILQADDGKLRPSVVTSDSISRELRTTLVEGVVMDAQAMLDRSLAAADSSSASALAAKASEERAASSSARAADSAKDAAKSAEALKGVVNPDWNATGGTARILNKPTTVKGYGITDAACLPTITTSADPLNLLIEPNMFYQFGQVSMLVIAQVKNGFHEALISFASGDIATTIAMPEALKHIGEWEIEPNGKYLMSILDNIAVLGKVMP